MSGRGGTLERLKALRVASVLGDLRIDQLGTDRLEALERSFLVRSFSLNTLAI